MRSRSLVAIVALALGAACGDPTGPLNGGWRYSTSEMTSVLYPNVICMISDVTMNLSHKGTSLTGRTSGGSVLCTSQGHLSVPMPLAADVSGFVRDSVINFTMVGIKNVGIRVGDQVVGVASVPVDIVSGDTVSISGQFRLLR